MKHWWQGGGRIGAWIGCCLSVLAAPVAARADDFFAGKTITLIVGADAGGGYDTIGRLMVRHMPRFIPGHPTFVVQDQPAAGGIVAANNLFNIAPRDGTTIGLLQREMLTAKTVLPQAVHFDVDKFGWLGSLAIEPSVVLSWRTSPVKTAQDLLTHELIVGGSGPTVGNEAAARLMNALIGTKFKIISGYPGTTDIILGMQRGELQGIVDYSYSNLVTRNADLIRNHDVTILLQLFDHRIAELPDVPAIFDFLKNDDDRAIMKVFLAGRLAARPVAAPPGVPAAQLAILRAAFEATVHDPDYIAEAKKAGLEVSATSGADVEKISRDLAATPADAMARYAKILSVN